VSGSWDATAKVWDLEADCSLMTCAEHTGMIYSTVWSPHNPGVFASASADGTLKIWDCRQPAASVQVCAAVLKGAGCYSMYQRAMSQSTPPST